MGSKIHISINRETKPPQNYIADLGKSCYKMLKRSMTERIISIKNYHKKMLSEIKSKFLVDGEGGASVLLSTTMRKNVLLLMLM